MGGCTNKETSVNFIRSDHEREISNQSQRMNDTEFNDRISSTEEGLSDEDRKAKQIMDESVLYETTNQYGHYQVKLPFPESRGVAERRMRWLKGKFDKDPELKDKYKKVLEDYEEEGSAKRVSVEELRILNPYFINRITLFGIKKTRRNLEWCLIVLQKVVDYH